MHTYDVIVLGGGAAGVVAAIQAGRAGAKTLLVEKTGMLGGTLTNGGVNFPGLFHAWGHQVIAGIGWELVSRCVAETDDSLPDFADHRRGHWLLHVRVDAWGPCPRGRRRWPPPWMAWPCLSRRNTPATVTGSGSAPWLDASERSR